MAKILILGSKPDANKHEFDIAFCANAASSFYHDKLDLSQGRVISVVSASELSENHRHGAHSKEVWLKKKRKQLTDNTKSRIILFGNEYFKVAEKVIEESQFSGILETITLEDTFRLQARLIGRNVPTLTPFHFSQSIRTNLRTLKLYLSSLRSRFGRSDALVSGLFRPSTGSLALLLAVAEHGFDNDFIVAGIGITNRGLYPDGKNNEWTPKDRLQSFHVHVDRYIFESLSQRARIHFDDVSLRYLNNEDNS